MFRTRGRVRFRSAPTRTTVEILSPTLTAIKPPSQVAAEFLGSISKRYIQAMRNATHKDGREVLYGGDIELIEIAKLLNIKIIVHKHTGNTVVQGPIFVANPAIGPADAPVVHLVLAGRHYQVCKVDESTKRIQILNVPPDGNCLFHACIRGKKLLEPGAAATSTIAEVLALRKQVCDSLQAILDQITRGEEVAQADVTGGVRVLIRADDPIHSRFAAILEAEYQEQLAEAIDLLPDGALVQEARAIKIMLLQAEGKVLPKRAAATGKVTPSKPIEAIVPVELKPAKFTAIPSTIARTIPATLKLKSKLGPIRSMGFNIEKLTENPAAFKLTITRAIGQITEKLEQVVTVGGVIGIPGCRDANVEVASDGSIHN